MRQLLVLSGKGGTGKTTVAASLIELAGCTACADCDVDAPNLHLIHGNRGVPETTDWHGYEKAELHANLCTRCGACEAACRFGAIRQMVVDPYACEGCAVCEAVCPVTDAAGKKAIRMVQPVTGHTVLYRSPELIPERPLDSALVRTSDEASELTPEPAPELSPEPEACGCMHHRAAIRSGPWVFSTAALEMGSGASGKLVSAVRKNLYAVLGPEVVSGKTEAGRNRIVILDGSPGIGCPVIASVTGVDLVLIVTEPTVSGLHDLKRLAEVAARFGVPCVVCVNRFDLQVAYTERIEEACTELGLPVIGRIPYDRSAVEAVTRGIPLVRMSGSPAAEAIRSLWGVLQPMLGAAPQ